MFGWNNDSNDGWGFGRGNGGRGRRGCAGAGCGNGQGFGNGSGRGRGRSGKGRGQGFAQGNGQGYGFGGGQGRGQGFGQGSGFGNGAGQGYGQGRFADQVPAGERLGRGPCGQGLNRFRPGRGGAFQAAMNTAPADNFGPDAGVCPLCDEHCPLSAPACPKGRAYAARMGLA